jgi:protein disulfide-isomerase A6
LKIVRPSKKSGRPTVEDYQGARSAKAIVDAVVEKIPNHVKRVTDNSLQSWLDEKNGTAKAILFTEKGTVSALLRALAIDYLGVINVGQVRSKEAAAVAAFGVDKFPSLVLLPGGDAEPAVYHGELKKEPMSEFLSQAGPPNPDPAPEAPKTEKKAAKKDKPAEKKAEEAKEEPAEEAAEPSAEPPKPAPKPAPVVPAIDEADLRQKCLSETSKICALLLLPAAAEPQEAAQEALRTVALVYDKHSKRHASFPFFAVAPTNPLAATLREALELEGESLQVIAVNAKRMWWRRYPGEGYAYDAVEAWVDAIRMNEGKKEVLPESLVPKAEEKVEDDVRERDEL